MKKLAFISVFLTSFSFAMPIEQIVLNSLNNNSDLKSLEHSIKVANKNITLAPKWKDPVLSIGFNDIQFQEPLKRDLEPMQSSYIGISQVIPTNNKIEIKEQIAKKNMQIKSLVLKDKKLKLKAKIYELSYSIVVLDKKLRLLNEYEKNLIKLQDLTNDFYKVGKVTQNEVLNIKVLLFNLKIKKQKLQNIIDNLYLKLEQISYMKIDNIDVKEELKPLVLNMNSNEHPKIKQEYFKSKKYIYQSKLEKAKEVPDVKLNVAYFNRDSKFEDYANISINIPLRINDTQSVQSLKAKFESNKVSSKLEDTKKVLKSEFETLINSANSAFKNYQVIKEQIIPIKSEIQTNLENYNTFSTVKPQEIIKNLNELISFEVTALDEKLVYFTNYSKLKYYISKDN